MAAAEGPALPEAADAADGGGELRWLEISELPPGLNQQGATWLEELGVKARSLSYRGFGPEGTESPGVRLCTVECASAEDAATALQTLAGASVGGSTLRAHAVSQPPGTPEAPSESAEQGTKRKADEALGPGTTSSATVSSGTASSTSAGARAPAGETLEQRAKRKAVEAAGAAAAYKKLAAAGKGNSVVNPATGETAEQRAKRKAKEAAEAAHLARKARQAADRPKDAQKDRGKNGTPAPAPAPAPSLYDGLPEPDPEKDALAAKLAEAFHKDSDSKKIKYTEDRTKIIFLDIDGVLRPLYGGQFQMSSITMDGENVPLVDGDTEFIPSAMHSLRQVLEQTNAALVLSSEWRRHPTLREGVNANLRQKGLPMVIDDTPTLDRELTGNPLRSFAIRRAREIGMWLKSHPDVRQWVALDDIDLGEADEERQPGQPLLTPRLVLTEKSACLLPADAQLAVNILNGKLNPPRVFDEIPS